MKNCIVSSEISQEAICHEMISQEKVRSVYWLLRESWKVLTWNTAFNQVPKILACAKGSGETLKIADADIIVGLL